MKVLKNSLFLLIVIVITNLVWALFYYNNQMDKYRQEQAQEISKDCEFTENKATCVYVQVRLDRSDFEKDLSK